MSRSSKGFADFFPTAPSVLQQKRSRTTLHPRKEAHGVPFDSSERHGLPTPEKGAFDNGRRHDGQPYGDNSNDRAPGTHPMITADTEPSQGDLLNGVGSASSTSTTSSGFSAARGPHSSQFTRDHRPSSMTPLTNGGSPASGAGKSPPPAKYTYHNQSQVHGSSSYPPPRLSRTSTNNHADNLDNSARPGKGKSRGKKILYDPELDKSLPAKERRSKAPKYEEITDQVCIKLLVKFCVHQ
jgi:histone-lysine N-methyltransferase SETD1